MLGGFDPVVYPEEDPEFTPSLCLLLVELLEDEVSAEGKSKG